LINARAAHKENENFVVADKMSDITTKVSNENAMLFAKKRASILAIKNKKTKLVPRSIAALKQANTTRPVLQLLTHPSFTDGEQYESVISASIAFDAKRAMSDMINRQGIDPSNITKLTHRSISARNTLQGMLRPERSPTLPFSATSRLLNFHVFNENTTPPPTSTSRLSDNAIVAVDEVVSTDEVEVLTKIIIPASKRFLRNQSALGVIVEFKLIDSYTKLTIDSIRKKLNLAQHEKLFYTPKEPPIVNVAVSEISSKANLEIYQTDPGATSVQVYQKMISRVVTDVEDYVLIGTYPLLFKQTLFVPVDKPLMSTALYRVVATGDRGSQGFEFTNVVIKPQIFMPMKTVSLSVSMTDIGTNIDVRSIPIDAVAIGVMKRNVTFHDVDYVVIDKIITITDDVRTSDHFSVQDLDVIDGCVYEYVAKLIYSSGLSEIAGHTYVEYVSDKPGRVDLKITDLSVSHNEDEPNVTFTIVTNVIDDDLDVIKMLLEKQGVYDLFKDEITNEREFLKGLIAHNVDRVDLTTGARETFGVVTQDIFDDQNMRRNSSVSPLKYGHKYRYDVSTLIRYPETLFDSFFKEKIDSVTKKSYVFKPSKFFHPLALLKGILLTQEGLKTMYSKDALSHGIIGTVAEVEVSFDVEPARVIDPAAAQFDHENVVVTWSLRGLIDQVDHFLIMKDVNGVRTVVGKAHSEFESNNCQFLHKFNEQDEGELKYVITPIFNDYSVGVSIVTNSVVIT